MLKTAFAILSYGKLRLLVTVSGVGVTFFIALAQAGLLVGWCATNSAILRHSGSDVWIMAEQTPAFDYGTPIPQNRLFQARSVLGVKWAEPLFVAFNVWQRPDGRRVNVELVGVGDGLIGGPWSMEKGAASSVLAPKTVVVDRLYLGTLGVGGADEEVELIGKRAVVGGISRGIRTFTACPYVFTSLRSAIAYDQRYRDDEITYVMVKCEPGYSPTEVSEALARVLPSVEVLTTEQFVQRNVRYWMLETGMGVTVVITAILGLLIGTAVTSQSLFAVTHECLNSYATLAALGFSPAKLSGVVAVQSIVMGIGGMVVGTALFAVAFLASRDTPIPLEATTVELLGMVTAGIISCLAASFFSVRSVFMLDPMVVFRN